MRILIIGEPCLDVIHKADGTVLNEPGGISYSVVASGSLDDGVETIPVIGLRRDDRAYFRELFSRLKNVDMSGIYEAGSPVRRVDLFYKDDNRRWECSTQPIEPTPFDRIEPFLPADGIHINLISGWDITLETLGKIRAASPGCHIHIDLHNIVMRHMPGGKRVRAPREDYLAWCEYADTVQMNEDEANIIDSEVKSPRELWGKILGSRARALIVSFAERGLSLYEKAGNKVAEHFFPPQATAVVDPTGSGDVFGATFIHAVVLGRNFKEAAEAGVRSAVLKVGAAGPGGFLKLRKAGADV